MNEKADFEDEGCEGEQVFLTGGVFIYSRIPTRELVSEQFPPGFLERTRGRTLEEFLEDTSLETLVGLVKFLNNSIVALWISPQVTHGMGTETTVGTYEISQQDKEIYLDWMHGFVPIFVPSPGIEA